MEKKKRKKIKKWRKYNTYIINEEKRNGKRIIFATFILFFIYFFLLYGGKPKKMNRNSFFSLPFKSIFNMKKIILIMKEFWEFRKKRFEKSIINENESNKQEKKNLIFNFFFTFVWQTNTVLCVCLCLCVSMKSYASKIIEIWEKFVQLFFGSQCFYFKSNYYLIKISLLFQGYILFS